jgi:hypothetical protein
MKRTAIARILTLLVLVASHDAAVRASANPEPDLAKGRARSPPRLSSGRAGRIRPPIGKRNGRDPKRAPRIDTPAPVGAMPSASSHESRARGRRDG